MLDIDDLSAYVITLQQRHARRDERFEIIESAVNGDFELLDEYGDQVDNKSPNLIQVALEDTAEAASLVPSVRSQPSSPEMKDQAAAMERLGTAYLDFSQVELLIIRTCMDLAAYGMVCWSVEIDDETGSPRIVWRNPRTIYPEMGFAPLDSARKVVALREMYVSQLPFEEWRQKVTTATDQHGAPLKSPEYWRDHSVLLVEYYDEEEFLTAVLVEGTSNPPALQGKRSHVPIELHREKNKLGICPVVVTQRMSLDGEIRGQFDQVVRVMKGHIQLMSTLLDYADQAVYCIAPHTQVLTENLEYIEVGKLEVGDDLIGFDEHPEDGTYRRWRRSTVERTGRRMLPSYKVTMADGTEFTASTDHKWLVGNSSHVSEWIPTHKLDSRFHSKYGVKVVKPLDLWERDESREAGYLAGVLDGEGWLSGNNVGSFRVGIAQRDNACLRDTERALVKLGFHYTKSVMSNTEDNPGGLVYNLQIRGGLREIVRLLMQVRPERLIEKFHTLGGAEWMGRFKRHELVEVTACEYVGDEEVVTLKTSSGTLIAEGYAHHNSDVWVKDLIGHMPVGGGSYIQLGPQGAIGRVQPAVSSLQVFEELDRLMDGIHVGGRWPKVRPGEVEQSIASAKFVEATAGMMNTTIRTMHFILKAHGEQALRVAFAMDKEHGKKRTVAGTYRNQQFMIERDVDDIDLGAKIRLEYGMGLGREPAQSMVLGIQAMQAGLVSSEFVQENFEGIDDVSLERRRIDIQAFRDMALARLMEAMQNGEVPLEALTKIAKARADGDDIFELLDEFVVKPQAEAADAAIGSGLPGQAPMAPGPGPSPEGGAAPPPPDIGGLLGGLGGGAPPPGGPDTISRLSTPLPGGGFAGSEVRPSA